MVSDHFPIILTSSLGLLPNKVPKVSNRRFAPDKIEAFNTRLLSLFENFNQIECANTAVNFFCETIESEIDKFFPMSLRSRKDAPLRPWIDKHLLDRINRKNQLYKEYVKNKSNSDLIRFKSFRNKLKRDIRLAKRKYYQKLLEENKDNAKKSWQILNEVTGRVTTKTCTIKRLLSEGQVITGEKEIASALNEFFSSIGVTINNNVPPSDIEPTSYIHHDIPETCFLDPVDINSILTILMDLNASGGTRSPTSVKVLQLLAPSVVGPLTHIVNLSFQTGCFPDRLKIATITPIFKHGKRDEPGNYRPISVLSPLSKILEKCVKKCILGFFESKNLFAQNQYGFRTNHSTEHALLNFIDYATDELENGNFVMGVYLDIKKAFDCVNFEILFAKLNKYGIRGQSLALLQDYLTNRKQKVKLLDDNGTTIFSDERDITCGVPQGSVLGPLLFLIYVNDFQNATSLFHTITFADDTNLFMASPSIELLCDSVNLELEKIKTWLDCNRLNLNVSKTYYQLYTKR